jgi:NAD(P)-dependent dehydrogenase (short-subunit alcohol dehydrogenase family)
LKLSEQIQKEGEKQMTQYGMFDLSGKVALITGGGSGFGRAFCEGMAEFGADVACCDIIEARAQETVDLVKKFGHRAIAIKADVSKLDEIEVMVDQTIKKLGSLNIVFANAGVSEKTRGIRIHEKPVEDWDYTMGVNLRGVFFLMRSVFPHMMRQKAGSFITTASIGGLWPVLIPAAAVYATSKAGVIMLTKAAARQYAEDGIRVNAICPGYHRTGMFPPEVSKNLEEYHISRIPLKRAGLPEEIKGLAIWLASDASRFVTGQIFIQDGGELA